jgi:hypothetical protein
MVREFGGKGGGRGPVTGQTVQIYRGAHSIDITRDGAYSSASLAALSRLSVSCSDLSRAGKKF